MFYSVTFKLIDRGLIEFFGPLSLVRFTNRVSSIFSSVQTGFIYNYIFVVLLGIMFFIFLIDFFISKESLAINFELMVCFLVCVFYLNYFSRFTKRG